MIQRRGHSVRSDHDIGRICMFLSTYHRILFLHRILIQQRSKKIWFFTSCLQVLWFKSGEVLFIWETFALIDHFIDNCDPFTVFHSNFWIYSMARSTSWTDNRLFYVWLRQFAICNIRCLSFPHLSFHFGLQCSHSYITGKSNWWASNLPHSIAINIEQWYTNTSH